MFLLSQDPRRIDRERLIRYMARVGWGSIVHQGKWVTQSDSKSISPAEIVDEIYGSDAASCGDADGKICLQIMSVKQLLRVPGSYQLWEFLPPCDIAGSRFDEISELTIVTEAGMMLEKLGGHELYVPNRIEIAADMFDIEGLTITPSDSETIIRIMSPPEA